MTFARNQLAALAILAAGILIRHDALAADIAVTTIADEFATGIGCSLREAIQSANTNADFGGCTHAGRFGTDTITLPAAFYSLSRVGTDDDNNVSGDLDIRSNLTIQGAGAGSTSIANCASCNDRVLQIVIGSSVVINDVTLRDGNLIGGRSGAGLRSEPNTSTTLNRVTVGLNTVHANAGGILNRGEMTLNSCAVTNNVTIDATEGGGGIFNDDDARLVLNDTRVLNNTTTGNGANGSGAGIYNDVGAELTMTNSTVDGNTTDIGGTIGENPVLGDGGGIYSAGKFQITQSTISNNVANGNDAHGGGISCDSTTSNLGAQQESLLSLSVVFGNHAVKNPDLSSDLVRGGGVYAGCKKLKIVDSVVSSNSSQGDGGGVFVNNVADIRNTTIAANNADSRGGGISFFAETDNQRLSIVDSSVISNHSETSGGGASIGGISNLPPFVIVLSSTIFGNTSEGDGGGLQSFGNASPRMSHTVIAGNRAVGSANHDDCDGLINSSGANLIQIITGCVLVGQIGIDLTGVGARLGVPANNGGPVAGASSGIQSGMLTLAPLENSPLIDPGPGLCTESFGVPLTTDQTGRNRSLDGPDPDTVAECDIGAIEYEVIPDLLFTDGFD